MMTRHMDHRDRRPLAFDAAAELYDRARPGYPAKLFDDLAADLSPGARLLELGCGTGQATIPLAEYGYQITALEPGPNLAAVARQKLARFPGVAIVVSTFEDWSLPAEPFDAVVSATAFHWIDKTVRVAKSADALRPNGVIATIATHHVAGGDAQFFIDVQACYRRWNPGTTGMPLPRAEEIQPDTEELDRSGRFEPATFRRYDWERAYATGEYVDLLNTYSDHRALDETVRRNLLECIAGLIAGRYGGRIRKRYLNELRVARRRETYI